MPRVNTKTKVFKTDTLKAFPKTPGLPKVDRVPIFSRAPDYAKGLVDEGQVQYMGGLPPNPPPELGKITKPEWAVYWALTKLGKKPGIDFEWSGHVMTSQISQKTQIDFLMIDGSKVAIEVQGVYWHYEQGQEKISQDLFRRTILMGQGYTVIFVDEDDVLRDPIYYTNEALKGHDHSYNTRGYFVQYSRTGLPSTA